MCSQGTTEPGGLLPVVVTPRSGGGYRPRMDRRPETIAVLGGRPHGPGSPLNAPIAMSSTYRTGGPRGYGRSGNETWDALEEVVGALEGGEAVAFATGIAAITAVLDQVPPGGVVVTSKPIYMGTWAQLEERAAQGRIEVRYVDPGDVDAVLAAARGAALIWLETPSNPTIGIADIAAIAAGRESGTLLGVDGTFTSPLVQQPLALGADVVVHSATKLLGGHADLLLGLVVGDAAFAERMRAHRSDYGAAPGSLEAFLALRGIRTLAVRLERAQASALAIAAMLDAHPQVTRVLHPSLPAHPGHEIATRQMRGYGTVLAFELAGGEDAAARLCAAVTTIANATSLGGVESLVEHRGAKDWERRMGTPAGLLRLSVGIEHVDDLLADLEQAIAAAHA
jgi:cystathionine gamma-synthase